MAGVVADSANSERRNDLGDKINSRAVAVDVVASEPDGVRWPQVVGRALVGEVGGDRGRRVCKGKRQGGR